MKPVMQDQKNFSGAPDQLKPRDHTHQDQDGVATPAPGSAKGPRESSFRDHKQRQKRLRGLTTSRSNHATAGKLVNRVSNDGVGGLLIRSSSLDNVTSTSSRGNACPSSSRSGADRSLGKPTQVSPQRFLTRGKQYARPHSSPKDARLRRSSPSMRRKAVSTCDSNRAGRYLRSWRCLR